MAFSMNASDDPAGRENVRVKRNPSGPETVPGGGPAATDDFTRRIGRIRAIARLMDNSYEIPGLKTKIGLDPIIGLIPGIGDSITTAVSLYIVYEGYKLGATRTQLVQMVGNVAIDALVGTVPVLGDLFDFAFKANARNLAILKIDPNG